jgi:hypothetical protein
MSRASLTTAAAAMGAFSTSQVQAQTARGEDVDIALLKHRSLLVKTKARQAAKKRRLRRALPRPRMPMPKLTPRSSAPPKPRRIRSSSRLIALTDLERLTELDRSTVGRNMKVLRRMGRVALTSGPIDVSIGSLLPKRTAGLWRRVSFGRQLKRVSKPIWASRSRGNFGRCSIVCSIFGGSAGHLLAEKTYSRGIGDNIDRTLISGRIEEQSAMRKS